MRSWNSIHAAAKRTEDHEWEKRMDELAPDDVINMQYTSGTTGYPKGVMLSHTNIVCNASQIADCMKLTQKDRMCIPVPFFHCFGSVLGVLACLTKGGTIIPIESFHPERVLQTVEKRSAPSFTASRQCSLQSSTIRIFTNTICPHYERALWQDLFAHPM